MKRMFAALAVLILAAACGHAIAAPERMIEKQAVVGAPIAEVWKAWTTSEGVKSFFAPDAKVGGRGVRPDGRTRPSGLMIRYSKSTGLPRSTAPRISRSTSLANCSASKPTPHSRS